MELRFLNGKLQFKTREHVQDNFYRGTDWADVPEISEKPCPEKNCNKTNLEPHTHKPKPSYGWCEHIKEVSPGYWRLTKTTHQNYVMNNDEDMFCPICGTPRPSEPKDGELWEKLLEAGWNFDEKNFISVGFCKNLASVAAKHYGKETEDVN